MFHLPSSAVTASAAAAGRLAAGSCRQLPLTAALAAMLMWVGGHSVAAALQSGVNAAAAAAAAAAEAAAAACRALLLVLTGLPSGVSGSAGRLLPAEGLRSGVAVRRAGGELQPGRLLP